jgi:hypothetical protein
VLNVLLAYHLGKGSNAMSYLLVAGGVAQAAIFAFVHGSGHALVAVDIAVAASLVVAHEVLIQPVLRQSIVWSAARVRR